MKKTLETAENRKLGDLVSVGPATIEDFEVLGISEVHQLREANADELFERLRRLTGIKHDICCLDVFNAAIHQARDPDLPQEKCQWWYWSKVRKQSDSSTSLG